MVRHSHASQKELCEVEEDQGHSALAEGKHMLYILTSSILRAPAIVILSCMPCEIMQ